MFFLKNSKTGLKIFKIWILKKFFRKNFHFFIDRYYKNLKIKMFVIFFRKKMTFSKMDLVFFQDVYSIY